MFRSDLQQQFWLTKKIVQRKLGSKEDECIQDSDAPLDSKICLFNSISGCSFILHKLIEQLIDKLDVISINQNTMGKFLNEIVSQTCISTSSNSNEKCTSTIGKALSYESQQINTLRPILSRFEHELSIFNNHAVSDVSHTVLRMEKERTEYRAALSWMKSASANMDPDSCKDIQKFRKTQNLVKKSKVKFEQAEKTCFQKIDLLSAARCNMLSHVLIPYQTIFLKLMKNVADVYGSTLQYLDQYDSHSKNMFCTLNMVIPNDDYNRLIYFEEKFKDDENSSPKEDEQRWLMSDSKIDNVQQEEVQSSSTSPLLLPTFDDNMMSNENQPHSNDIIRNQSWFDIFADLDPLANNKVTDLLKNSEAT